MKLRRALLAVLLVIPTLAWADFTVAGSYGKALEVSPTTTWQPSNFMVAPGYSFLADILRLELGFGLSLPDGHSLPSGQARSWDFQIRPMLVVAPPLFPVYARLITAASDLTTTAKFQYGGALGISAGVGSFQLFLEAGIVPIIVSNSNRTWLEGRAGMMYEFK